MAGKGKAVARRLLLGAYAFASLLGGLAAAPALAFSGRMSVESGGITRTAIVVEHDRLKRTRRAVVLVLHGGSGNGARIRRNLGFDEIGRLAGRILVYPDAVDGHWGDAEGPAAVRDVTFIRDLITKLVSDGIADRRRIFLVGTSTGGGMALRAICQSGEAFAGAAVLIAGMPADLATSCKPPRPLALMMVLGTADTLVPYNGGVTNLADSKIEILPADTTLAIFARAASCSDTRTTTAIPDHDAHDGSRVYIEKFTGCKAPVELLRVEGGGHSIPGRVATDTHNLPSSVGTRNNDVDTTKLIADFFRPLGG